MKRYKVICPDTYGYASFSFSVVDTNNPISGCDERIYELVAITRNEKNAKLLCDALNFYNENDMVKEIK